MRGGSPMCAPTPNRSSKVTEQPSSEKADWRCRCHGNRATWLCLSLIGGNSLLFPRFLFPSSIVLRSCFFIFCCHSKRTRLHGCSCRNLRVKSRKEHSEEQPVTYCSSNPSALQCCTLCRRHPRTFTVLFTSSAMQELLPTITSERNSILLSYHSQSLFLNIVMQKMLQANDYSSCQNTLLHPWVMVLCMRRVGLFFYYPSPYIVCTTFCFICNIGCSFYPC